MAETFPVAESEPANRAGSPVASKAEALDKAVQEIRQLHDQARQSADELRAKQGPIGFAVDGAVNAFDRVFYANAPLKSTEKHYATYGTFALDKALDAASKAINRLANAAREGRVADFRSEYKAITGKDWTGDLNAAPKNLPSKQALQQYKDNHYFFHDLSTSYAAVYAGMIARTVSSNYVKGFGLPFAAAISAGALAKPLLTGLDGEHFYPRRDATVGAIWGGLYPVYEFAGARTSEMLLRSNSIAKFIGKGQIPVLETPGLFTSAIKPVQHAAVRSALISDAAFVVPGWIAYDSIGYPAQLIADKRAFHKELPSIGDTGVSHARGIAVGLIAGPLVGVPLAQGTRYLVRPVLERLMK